MIPKNIKYCLIIFLCLINVHCYAENITSEILSAKVIKVVDGDTVYLKHEEYGKLKIRLADIDAPEKDQPHGIDATKTLKKLIDKRSVKLKKVTVDRYNRIVGIPFAIFLDFKNAYKSNDSSTFTSKNRKLLPSAFFTHSLTKGAIALHGAHQSA